MGKSKVEWHQSKDNAKELAEWLAHFPCSITMPYLGLGVMSDPRTEWCRCTLGKEFKRWTVNRINDHDREMIFYFANERDLTLFRLQWC
jgi:hypothetical protein